MAKANSSKTVVVVDIKHRDSRKFGRHHAGEVMKGHHAVIRPGVSITLAGEIRAGSQYVRNAEGRQVPCDAGYYERRFKVGGVAVYGSYNLVYTGIITAIGEKTISIEDHGRVHRLDLASFSWRNRDFDLAEISKRNQETMHYI